VISAPRASASVMTVRGVEMETIVFVRKCRICFVSVIACLLAACNYGEDSSAPAASGSSSPTASSPVLSGAQSPPASATGDHAPQITGAAVTGASVGQTYRFQPSATDADGDVLTFTLLGAPNWLKLNSATGLITGTPTSADVGVDAGIVLQVSDGKATVSLAPFTITVAAAASSASGDGNTGTGSVDLAWIPPTENTDGSALVNLNGYKIYYGNSSKNYTTTITVSNPGLTSYVIESLPPGTYFFSVTATTSSGIQSGYSPEASTTIT
jgi:Putative Ig domain